MERLEVRFSGHVQGVGFRYTTRRIAERWPVTGYVENCDDGSVSLVAEGRRPDLQAFLDEIQEAMQPNIRTADAHWYRASEEFEGFTIRRLSGHGG